MARILYSRSCIDDRLAPTSFIPSRSNPPEGKNKKIIAKKRKISVSEQTRANECEDARRWRDTYRSRMRGIQAQNCVIQVIRIDVRAYAAGARTSAHQEARRRAIGSRADESERTAELIFGLISGSLTPREAFIVDNPINVHRCLLARPEPHRKMRAPQRLSQGKRTYLSGEAALIPSVAGSQLER